MVLPLGEVLVTTPVSVSLVVVQALLFCVVMSMIRSGLLSALVSLCTPAVYDKTFRENWVTLSR